MKAIKTYLSLLVVSLLIGNIQAQTMHTILVADTYDIEIGESCLTDFSNMQPLAAQMAKSCGFEHKLYPYKAGDFDKETLMNGLSAIQGNPKDVVFFFYAGHGIRDENSKWPKLVLENGEIKTPTGAAEALPLTKIEEMLTGKGFGFSMLVTDCCNNTVAAQEIAQRGFKPVSNGASTTKAISTIDRFYQSLLKNNKGTLLVSSSSPEEKAVCYRNEGGLFSNSLLQVFERMSEDHPQSNWDDVMTNAKKLTLAITLEAQTPIWELNLKQPINQVVTSTTVTPKVKPIEMTSGYVQLFLDLADNSVKSDQRIKLIPTVLEKVFASPNAIVEIYGRNGSTRVGLESAQDFVERLFTSTGLVSLSELGVEKDASTGKITKLKLHETYQL